MSVAQNIELFMHTCKLSGIYTSGIRPTIILISDRAKIWDNLVKYWTPGKWQLLSQKGKLTEEGREFEDAVQNGSMLRLLRYEKVNSGVEREQAQQV